MIAGYFQHDLMRKYISIFGTLFNDVYLKRKDGDQYFKVPISYGPREKYLAMIMQKPADKVKQIQLPRMAFEMTGMSYDTTRKINNHNTIQTNDNFLMAPVPWSLNFQLSIIAKEASDCFKIVEQVLVHFRPDVSITIKPIEEIDDMIWNVPIIYNGIDHEDTYKDSTFDEKRVVMWNIDFTMKTWLFGPVSQGKVIKHIEINKFADTNILGGPVEVTTIIPGVTAQNTPTTDINEAIPYQDVEEDMNWTYLIQFEDNIG